MTTRAGSQPVPDHRRDFGRFLKQARENTGKSQQDMAEEVGISAAMLSHVESGRRVLGDEKLGRLAEVLGIDRGTIAGRRAMLSSQDLVHRVQQLAVEPWPAGPVYRRGLGSEAPDGTLGSAELDDADPREASTALFLAQIRNAMVHGSSDSTHASSRVDLLAILLDELRTLAVPELAVVRAFIHGIKAADDLRRPSAPQPATAPHADTRPGPTEPTTATALAKELGISPETVISKVEAQTGISISPTTPLNIELAEHIRDLHSQ